jgi:iron(III) transport system permease protein
LCALFVLALGVPLLALLATSFLAPGQTHLTLGSLTLANYSRALSDPTLIGPLLLSLRLAAIAATGSVVLGAVVAPLLVRRRRRLRHTTLDLALLATVGIPSIVIGIGFLFAYNLPFVYRLIPIYGTNTLLVAGYLAGQTPIAARLLAGRAAQLQPSLMQAARVHGHGPLQSWRQAVLPLMAPSLIRGWMLVFAVLMFELPLSEILHPAGVPPLAVAITHQLRYDYAGGTALTAIAALITLGAIGMVAGLYRLLSPGAWREPARGAHTRRRRIRGPLGRLAPRPLPSREGSLR